MPRDVLCEKPQYQVTVFLKQEVFAAVTPVVFCIGKMESAVNLYGKSLQERARLIISVAHPSVREDLSRAAHERFGKHYHD